jgi:hypothetical protein
LHGNKIFAAAAVTRTKSTVAATVAYPHQLEIKMVRTTQLDKLSNKIADAIVDLVNDTDGPLTLLQVDREVPGFAKSDLPAFNFMLPGGSGDAYIWGGMTESGAAALRKVIYGRRVAIQFVTPQPYIQDGCGGYFERDDWQALMLLPAGAANFSAPKWLVRLSTEFLNRAMAGAVSMKRTDVHLLSPQPMRYAMDYFSVGDPRNHFQAFLVRATAA